MSQAIPAFAASDSRNVRPSSALCHGLSNIDTWPASQFHIPGMLDNCSESSSTVSRRKTRSSLPYKIDMYFTLKPVMYSLHTPGRSELDIKSYRKQQLNQDGRENTNAGTLSHKFQNTKSGKCQACNYEPDTDRVSSRRHFGMACQKQDHSKAQKKCCAPSADKHA